MRARSLKPSLFGNELLGTADPLLTLLFEGLWCIADREGRLEDRPARIKALVFPYRETVDVEGMLTWLSVHNFIHRYAACGLKLIQVLMFGKHQRPHNKESASVLPESNQAITENPNLGEGEHQPRSVLARSDSGLLTPDSGLLTADTPQPQPRSGLQHVHESESDIRRHIDAIKAVFPKAARQDWITAEKLIRNIVTNGTPWADITEGVSRYAKLCAATNRSAQNPGMFFGAVDEPWVQEWPLPGPPTNNGRAMQPAPDHTAAWAELESNARAIGFRARVQTDTLDSYRTDMMLSKRPKRGAPDLTGVLERMRMPR
jgi:hypothetical protein